MAHLKQSAVDSITAHIAKCGGKYSDWYVGITSDPQKRVFDQHRVNKGTDAYIICECMNSDIARAVEEYLVSTLRTAGDTGGGDMATKYVYAYKIGRHTIEST